MGHEQQSAIKHLIPIFPGQQQTGTGITDERQKSGQTLVYIFGSSC